MPSFAERLALCAAVGTFAVGLSSPGLAEPPPRPPESIEAAERLARDVIYADHTVTFYCGCYFTVNGEDAGGDLDPKTCGYEPSAGGAAEAEAKWQRVVPKARFGDEPPPRIAYDLHNLVPVVEQLIGRLPRRFGLVTDEPTSFGTCDFEFDAELNVTEPGELIRGDVARIWLYMRDTYGVALTATESELFETWNAADPPDDWERLRDRRIFEVQGNHNPYIAPQ